MEIKVGQIWQVVTDNFWTSGRETLKVRETLRKCKANIQNGEFIEIRYPYDWHFRTIDRHYDHAEPKEILKNCRFYGEIHEDVRSNNRKDLKEILDEKLYTPVWEVSQ